MDSSCLPALPVRLLDWYVAEERRLAAAGDEDADARLAAMLGWPREKVHAASQCEQSR